MCCIGKYGVQPIIEYYTGEQTRINSKGFANVSVENTGSVDAYLGEFKSPLEQGQIECFSVSLLPMTEDLPLSWAQNTNPLSGRIKVIKYKITELCN